MNKPGVRRDHRQPPPGGSRLELAALVCLLAPGVALFLAGVSRCASCGRSAASVALATAGLCLVLSGGLYHYWTDYRGVRPGPLLSFLGLSLLSVVLAVAAAAVFSG